MTDRIDISGKDVDVNERGLSCFHQKIEILKDWKVDGKICTFEGLVTIVTFNSPFDNEKLKVFIKGINKSVGSSVKLKNGGAIWLGGDGMKMNSLFIFANKKDGINATFASNPAISKIPPKNK